MTPKSCTQWVLQQANALGFALCGVAPADASPNADTVRTWLADEKHGEMHYLAQHLPQRLAPTQLMPGCRSIIVTADFYKNVNTATASADRPAARQTNALTGKTAAYAQVPDYHKTIKKRLHRLADVLREKFPDAEFKTTVDTAPTLEREHAAQAGLGYVGKHTLLIHPRLGSWMLVGCLFTTLDLATTAEMDFPQALVPPTDRCGTCTRCIDACPTDAITPYSVDATRCISYLTIEHRSEIDPTLEAGMQTWIAGCDICQDVCPHNRPRPTSPEPSEIPEPPEDAQSPTAAPPPATGEFTPLRDVPLLDILNWTEDDRRAALRGNALKRIKLEMWKRNALIAAGNAPQSVDAALLARIREIAHDPQTSDMLRRTARRTLAQLQT